MLCDLPNEYTFDMAGSATVPMDDLYKCPNCQKKAQIGNSDAMK